MNRRVVLVGPADTGIPQPDHFAIVAAPVSEPGDGEVLVRNLSLSVDPAMRGGVSAESNYAST